MDSKKKFLSVFVVLAVLVYVLPAAIAGSSGNITDNIIKINNLTGDNLTGDNLSDDNVTGDNLTGGNVTDDVIIGNSTNENATNDDTTTSPCENVTCDDLIANFTADITCGYSPLTVNFNDTSQGEPTEWYWDFGDGGNSTEQNPVHTYCDSGKYDVTLIVTNDMGNDTIIKYDYISVGGPRNAQETGELVTDYNENKTVCKDTTPICKETKPVCKPVSKPVCKENKPVSKPVCKENKPVSKPVCKETKPVCKPKPVREDTDQVSDDTQDEVNDSPDKEVCEEPEEEVSDNNQQDTANGVNSNCTPV